MSRKVTRPWISGDGLLQRGKHAGKHLRDLALEEIRSILNGVNGCRTIRKRDLRIIAEEAQSRGIPIPSKTIAILNATEVSNQQSCSRPRRKNPSNSFERLLEDEQNGVPTSLGKAYRHWNKPRFARRKPKKDKPPKTLERERAAYWKEKKSYSEYLQTDWWQWFRVQALNHHGRKCICCGRMTDLDLHHKSYRLFSETFEDVEVRCRDCHAIVHEDKYPSSDSISKEYAAMFSVYSGHCAIKTAQFR